MKKILFTLVTVLFLSASGYAQDYNTAIGVRGGLFNGITLKHYIGSASAVEGIVTTRWSGFNITGLYELHTMDVFDVNRLNFYYGLGGHIGIWDANNVPWDADGYTVIGNDGILGLEYNFQEIPFNISVDWKPALNLVGYSSFWADGGAVSIRYLIN